MVEVLEKKDLKQFEGSQAQNCNQEGYRLYELYSQPLFKFELYNENWEYDDFTDK